MKRTGARPQRYLIALGSNVPHPRHGAPERVLRAAGEELQRRVTVEALSPILASRPLGPSRRRYANAAAVVATELAPPALLDLLQAIERAFGRRRRGARWRARVLDLDVVLWSGGSWRSRSPHLLVPHPEFRRRSFVLAPAVAIAPRWRDPLTGVTLRHLAARLTSRRPLPTARARAGP